MMVDTFAEFVTKDDSASRATFEAAMKKRIETEGYKMWDLMYEVYCCQASLRYLSEKVEKLVARASHKRNPKSK